MAASILSVSHTDENEPERNSSLRSLENHVIPAKAGIHRLPNQRWAPAFGGATTVVIFIPLGGSQAHAHSE